METKCCEHLDSILKIERAIILEHISEHKWCNHIVDENEAIIDFVQKFAWLMREVYCGAVCPFKDGCEVNDHFQKVFLDDISDGEIREYVKYSYGHEEEDLIKLKLHVIKHDIKCHKWLNKIGTYEEAVKDFLQKFGWLIFDMYKRNKKEESNGNRR